MNSTAIVPAPASALVIAAQNASPPPPARGPKGLPFSSVYADVMQRADDMLPDRVVHVADLRMTAEGAIELPGGTRYRLNDTARRHLSSALGLRWQKWFESASGEERAEEVNRRFSRTPGEKKIRAWKDPAGEADGVARAFLAPSFTPIDDARYAEYFVMQS